MLCRALLQKWTADMLSLLVLATACQNVQNPWMHTYSWVCACRRERERGREGARERERACMHVHVRVRVRVRVCVCVCACAYVHVCVCVCVFMRIDTYQNKCVWKKSPATSLWSICVHTYMHVCMYAYMCTHICARIYACTHGANSRQQHNCSR